MFSKKAQDLPLNTLVKVIIIIIVLAIVILFFSKYSSTIFKSFADYINAILGLQ